MALSRQEITDILESKRFTCSNIDEYKNLDTILHLTCDKGHHIDAALRSVRNANFRCPYCAGNDSVSDKLSGITPPPKSGFRIIALDNATENAGLSIFDDGKLVFYHLLHFEGDTIGRIMQNKNTIKEVVIKQWQPDLIVLEDIQQQVNVQVFKTLAMLLGNALVVCRESGVKCETVLSKVWRSHYLIPGRTRAEQKAGAIKKVKDMYGINVVDDIAEAILMGKYAVDVLSKQTLKKKLF